MSKKPGTEPKSDWLPLGRGVFELYARKDPETLRDLADVLKTESGALDATIRPSSCIFSFHFFEKGSISVDGTPWAIVRDCSNSAEEDGSVLWKAHPASIRAAVCKATTLVWHKLIFPAFGRAVSQGHVNLYARLQRISAPLEPLPADVWPLLNVSDWQRGVAVGPEGTLYWAICVEIPSGEEPTTQRFRPAPKSRIREVIKDVYDTMEADRRRPPNIKELPRFVLPILEAEGFHASRRSIMQEGGAKEFASRRWPQGKRERGRVRNQWS